VNPSAGADKIVIFNSKREMSLLKGGEVLRSYRASLGNHPVGAKTPTGDGCTPEGAYTLDGMNPQSRFHLSKHISYPNLRDMEKVRRQDVQPGGDITVHGPPYGLGCIDPYHRFWDWTNGSMAVTNHGMDQIWRAVPDGTQIAIDP
jgi:murein L,D-transpeptidase YafK